MAQVLKLQLCSVRTPPHKPTVGISKLSGSVPKRFIHVLIVSGQSRRTDTTSKYWEISLCFVSFQWSADSFLTCKWLWNNRFQDGPFKFNSERIWLQFRQIQDWKLPPSDYLRLAGLCLILIIMLKMQRNFLYLHGKHTSQLISTPVFVRNTISIILFNQYKNVMCSLSDNRVCSDKQINVFAFRWSQVFHTVKNQTGLWLNQQVFSC